MVRWANPASLRTRMLMNLENLSVPNLKELALASQLLERRAESETLR